MKRTVTKEVEVDRYGDRHCDTISLSRDGKSVKNSTDEYFSPKYSTQMHISDIFKFVPKQCKFPNKTEFFPDGVP